MTEQDAQTSRLRFAPTSGVATGWAGLALVAVVVVLALLEQKTLTGLRVLVAGLWVAVLIWAFMLRPRIEVGTDWLRLRNPLSDYVLPLAAVEKVIVRSVTFVYVGEKKYAGVAVGQSRRQMNRPSGALGPEQPVRDRIEPNQLARFVEDQILKAAAVARHGAGGAGRVQRRFAVPEIVALVGLAIFFVVLLQL